MGGLGMVLTALVERQQRTLNVSIVMPMYRFLRNDCDRDGNGGGDRPSCPQLYSSVAFPIRPLICPSRTWLMLLRNIWSFVLGQEKVILSVDVYRTVYRNVTIFLIGPGNQAPFHNAFDVSGPRKIYSSPWPLSNEMQNVFFCKAAAVFLQQEYWRHKLRVIPLHLLGPI
jgi:hypothetical protein